EVTRGLSHRQRLERPAHREEVADLVGAVVEHEDAVAGERVDQPLALEAAHGVPDRGAADSEVAADLLDVQLRAGREDLAQDEVAHRPVYSLPETLWQNAGGRRAGGSA